MKPSQPYRIASNDRLALVGKTGVGKTEAFKQLVWKGLPDVMFIDVKGREYRKMNGTVLRTLDEVHEALFPDNPEEELTKFIFVPETPDLDTVDDALGMAYKKGNIHVYLDEMKTVYHGRKISYNHNLIMTNGRDKGVGMSSSTQRPMHCPREAFSESEHIMAFRLRDPDDRDRIESIMAGSLPADLLDLDRYHFIYDHEEFDNPELCQPLPIG